MKLSKKVIAVAMLALVSFIMVKCVKAEGINLPDLIKKLPALNQSVLYSIPDAEFNYATSVTLVDLFNEKVKIDIGYSPEAEVLGLVSFKLIEVKNFIKFPILDLVEIEPYIWGGLNRIEDLKELGETDYGVGVKIISLKF